MSAFSELCIRARKLGAARLIFTVDIFDTDENGICGNWTCIGGGRYGEDSVGIAHGRTGEEALRHLVTDLETKGPTR